jgi:membrane-bound metal-dependent hydrolase YbcI (DUF457 family)
MFILFHLVCGLVIGYLLADRYHAKNLILPCIVGALLPDLIDKPLGLLILSGSVGSGRIFSHSLLFLLVLSIVGWVLLSRYRTPALLAVAIGVASHQVLDLMWEMPRTWFYPFLGRFDPINQEGWFLSKLLLELQNPVEWASAILLCLVLLALLSSKVAGWMEGPLRPFLRPTSLLAGPLLAVAGIVVLSCGITGQYTPLTGWSAGYNIVGGLTILLAGYAAYRFHRQITSEKPSIGLK